MLGAATRWTVDYCRISADKRGAAEGVGTQHIENETSAEELGLSITRTYVDNDRSAYSGSERPDYLRLLDDMRAGLIGVIIIRHADRLHRSVEEVMIFIDIARAHKVKLYSGMRGSFYNLEKAAGRKDLIKDTLDAQYESDHRGERVTDARKRQARTGTYGGGVRPYGWGVDTGRVRSVCVNPKAPIAERRYEDRPVLDMTQHRPDEAAEIQRWAKDLLAGVSMAHVLADLTARRVPTAAQTDGRTLRRGGKEVEHGGWNSRTLRQILTGPRVSGHTVYRGEIVTRNAHEAIIPEDQRQALITLFADPARKTMKGNTPKWLGSLIYRCGWCDDGTTMSVRYMNGRAAYTCRAKNHTVHWVDRTDAYVETVLIERLSCDDIADLLPTGAGQTEDLTALREELVMLEARRRESAAQYARVEIEKEDWDIIRTTTKTRVDKIWETLRSASAESPLSDFVATDDAARTWADMHLGRRKEILRTVMTVTLLPIGRGRRQVDIRDYVIIGPAGQPAPLREAV